MKYDFSKLCEQDIINLIRSTIYLNDIPEAYRTETICLEAVKINGLDLQYIKNPTEEMKLLAVKKDGLAIRYIKKPSVEMQLEAVKEDGCSIQFINNPSLEMKLIAVKKNSYAIKYIPNPNKKLKLLAIKANSYNLECIKNQTLDLCIMAVKQNSKSLKYVNTNLLKEVLKNFPNIKFFRCKKRNLLCEFINNEWLFTIGCQTQITKEQFIDRIYNTDGGLKKNPHREEYLKILEQF